MISKTSTMHSCLFSNLQAVKNQPKVNIQHEYDDEYISQNLKKAGFSVSNNFGEVVNKFKSTFFNK